MHFFNIFFFLLLFSIYLRDETKKFFFHAATQSKYSVNFYIAYEGTLAWRN